MENIKAYYILIYFLLLLNLPQIKPTIWSPAYEQSDTLFPHYGVSSIFQVITKEAQDK